MKTEFRYMVLADRAAVLSVERCSFGADAWDEDTLRSWLRLPHQIGVVALDAGNGGPYGTPPVAGYVLYVLEAGLIRVARLGVAPRYRRRGVGRALLGRMEAKLTPQRRTAATLAVPDRMLDAHLWLRACGWTALGVAGDEYLFAYRLAVAEAAAV